MELSNPSYYTTAFSKQSSSSFISQSVQCNGCGVNILANDSPYSLLGNLCRDLKYNEPTSHYFQLITDLNVSLTPENRITIYRCSPKDDYLAQSLFNHHPSKYVIFPEYLNLHELNNIAVDANSLFLCIRYIEHVNSYDYLQKLFTAIHDSDSFIYFEILDFQSLINAGDYSFIWNERVSYPTQPQIKSLLSTNGFACSTFQFSSSQAVEPFLSFFARPLDTRSWEINSALPPSPIASTFSLSNCESIIIQRLKYSLSQVQSISFYGVGNKSMQLSLYINQYLPSIRLEFFDGTALKVGSKWLTSTVKHFDSDFCQSDLYIFSFDNSYSKQLQSTILFEHPSASIKFISKFFSIPEYEKNC
ncbi:hypothetical protein SynA1524_00100 [Synechococcus sp. A15-24]|nr:hypothetical protein SynA1524_00100 [Synechococcus sp. A15-24]